MTLDDELKSRWTTVWDRVGTSDLRRPSAEPILAMYASSDRRYHDLRHLADCLREFDTVATACADSVAVELAIWFHDCVYDPTRHDNEERSADVAEQMLTGVRASRALVATVRQLILATKHREAPSDPDAQLLVDIDLSILGKPPAEFDAYERTIREEYRHVPDDAYHAGRAAILRRFLDRPHIYQTPVFRSRFENQARSNLQRSLSRG